MRSRLRILALAALVAWWLVPAPATAAPAAAAQPSAASADFADGLHGWVLLQQACSTGCPPGLLRTTDGGVTWHPTAAPPVAASQVRFLSAAVGYAFGPGLAVTTDGGNHWRALGVPGGRGVAVAALEVRRGAAFLATLPADPSEPGGAHLFSSTPGSTSWRAVPGGDLPADTGAGAGVRIGVDGSQTTVLGLTPAAGIVRSLDSRHWRHATDPCPAAARTPTDIDQSLGQIEIVCWNGDPSARGVTRELIAFDAGGFTVVENPRGGGIPQAFAGYVLASGGGSAVISVNGGAALRTGISGTWTRLLSAPGARKVGVLEPRSGAPGRVYASRDNGVHWQQVDLTRRSLPPSCAAGQLRMRGGAGGAGLGHNYLQVYLRNVSASFCSLTDYPTVTGVGGQNPGGFDARRAPGSYFVAGRDTGPAIVRPGGDATFFLSGSDGPPGDLPRSSCTSTKGIIVRLPGGATLSGPIGYFTCSGTSISPLLPGMESPQ